LNRSCALARFRERRLLVGSSFLFEQIHPVLVRDDDGGLAAGAERPDCELRSDSGSAVDDVLRPIAMTPVFVPDRERRPTWIHIIADSTGS